MEPSKDFLKALKKEKKRLENEVSKIDPQSPDAYKKISKLAATYSEYFDKHHEPMMAIEFKNFIMEEIHDRLQKILQDILAHHS